MIEKKNFMFSPSCTLFLAFLSVTKSSGSLFVVVSILVVSPPRVSETSSHVFTSLSIFVIWTSYLNKKTKACTV